MLSNLKNKLPSSKALLILASSAILLSACTTLSNSSNSSSNNKAVPQSVEAVDIDRYTGTWYEIARMPLYFQRNCASDVTANYSLNPSGSIRVDNRCKKADGSTIQSIGEATKANETGSELKVTFLPEGLRWLPFTKADYWVLALDDDYQHALVGTPNHKYLWVLSRTPSMDEATYQALLNTAKNQGYDITKVDRTPQSAR